MNKAKTNALDALRALIAERQQYEQWISVLGSKRDGTPAHVFEKVNADYESRLDRVVGEIAGHAEELQLSIATLSSRLIEVAREEDTRRDTLQEAELRAAVGEYEPVRWEEMRVESQRELDRIAADRERLDTALAELRSIQTLSGVGTRQPKQDAPVAPTQVELGAPPASDSGQAPAPKAVEASETAAVAAAPAVAGSSSSPAEAPARARSTKTPPAGTASGKSARAADARVEQSKTLKCPECGTPNHPTEWYCERCGGELATM